MGIEDCEKLDHGVGVPEVQGGARGQWPPPLEREGADAERWAVGDDGLDLPQGVGKLVPSRSDEGIREGNGHSVLWVLAVSQPGQLGVGGGRFRITAQGGKERRISVDVTEIPEPVDIDRVVDDLVGPVPLAGHEQGLYLVAHRHVEAIDVTAVANEIGGSAGDPGGGDRIRSRQQVSQVEKGPGLRGPVPGSLSELGGVVEMGGCLDHAIGEAKGKATADEQLGELGGVDLERLTQTKGFGRQRIRVRPPREDLLGDEMVQSSDGVVVGVGAKHVQGGAQARAGFAVAPRSPQRVPGQCLDARRGPGLSVCRVELTGVMGIGE
jgi:hypothetical protein